MLVYTYQAALLCEACGGKTRAELTAEGKAPEDPEDFTSYDSDDFPKGPEEEGESDSPSHCDACGRFLESPLTSDGQAYVLETVREAIKAGKAEADSVALREWAPHYEIDVDEIRSERLRETYEPKITRILESVRDAAREAGYHATDVGDMTDEDYSWSVGIRATEHAGEWIDVKITIAESEHWDGEENGINFMLDVVASGGVMIGGCIPYNYTDEVWVKRNDTDAIAERWSLFQPAADDASTIVDSVATYYREHPKALTAED